MIHDETPNTSFSQLMDQAYQTVTSALGDQQDHYWNAKVDF